MSPTEILRPKRAIISVYDKIGVTQLAQALHDYGCEILSSGGTAQHLAENGIPVIEISDYTGAAEMFSGRVKTLHPRIHGGILARRQTACAEGPKLKHCLDDSEEMKKFNIPPIDIVCVNLYPFGKVIKEPDVALDDALENIDIGGPTLIRAAAKNFPSVCVLTDSSQYSKLLGALRKYDGIPRIMREGFARAAFHHTAMYDTTIARYFRGLPLSESNEDEEIERTLPQFLPLALTRASLLRYGENPHQKGAYYRLGGDVGDYITDSAVLQGKEISYNNILDIDAVIRLVREFPGEMCAAIVKHQNPTGVAVAATAEEAYRMARSVDELAAFGNVTGISGVVDEAAALAIKEAFVEVVVASDFTPEAREVLRKKKNLRLVATDLVFEHEPGMNLTGRALIHGMLVQEIDDRLWDDENFRIVSKRQPTDDEMKALTLAWKVVKHVSSNATVLATPSQSVGTGPGQTARVDTFRIAILKAGDRAKGAVAATDGFCFPDSVEVSHEAGITAIIEPGGSKSDKETIEKADELGLALVMTGMRHFKH